MSTAGTNNGGSNSGGGKANTGSHTPATATGATNNTAAGTTTTTASTTAASHATASTITTTANTTNAITLGTALWQKQPKVNAEFFALTYGACVAELLRDLEDPARITAELDRMGHSIGVRCVEEVLAKAKSGFALNNGDFGSTHVLCVTAWRMFLGLHALDVQTVSETEYRLLFVDNPLSVFVELPASNNNNKDGEELEYSQLLCGMIRGMLEMLQFDVSCRMVQTTLRGGDTNELSVTLNQVLQDGAGDDYGEE